MSATPRASSPNPPGAPEFVQALADDAARARNHSGALVCNRLGSRSARAERSRVEDPSTTALRPYARGHRDPKSRSKVRANSGGRAKDALARALRRALVLALAMPAIAFAEPSAGRASMLRAVRSGGVLVIDGKLDEPAWEAAEPFRDFVQIFPEEGRSPSESSEVRVLYDDSALYVGVRCRDSRPAEIVKSLGRRDSLPTSDLVRLYLDPNGDGRTALHFAITAGGVLADALVYDDDRITYDWDAVWEGASAMLADGWSAEFAIPLAILDYPSAPTQRWGFGVQREMGRNRERSATMLVARNARGLSSRLGQLVGLEGIEPRADVEVAPYLSGRMVLRPQYSDPSAPWPRIAEPVGNFGADFRTRLGPRLGLTGTVNPDFGQVEADQIILNLSNFEYYFPEKRPFFMQGLDLFKSVGDGNEQPPHQLFYSRRIGLTSAILGAAKLVGHIGEKTQIGLLDALVAGTGQAPEASEAAPDRRLRWSLAQPFQLAPGLAYPFQAPVTQNYFAGVVRSHASSGLMLGATATSSVPLARSCTEADLADPVSLPARCSGDGGNALALDFNATSDDREWYAYGQLVGSQVVGGPPKRILTDGTEEARGDLGFGSYLQAGRRGGEPWRFDLAWNYASPRLDLTASGFQKTQNAQYAGATLRYARPSGGGPWHDYALYLKGWSQWTTDGRGLSRGYGGVVGYDGLLKAPYLDVGCSVEYTVGRFDVRDIRRGRGSPEGAGIAEELPAWLQPMCSVETDAAQPFSVVGSAYFGKDISPGPLRQSVYYGLAFDLDWRPHPRAETKLGAAYDLLDYSIKYIDGLAPNPLLFGEIVAPSLSLTLRQTFVLTTTLTFQLYAQLFAAHGEYGPFYAADPKGTGIVRIRDLRRVDPSTDPAFAPFETADFKAATLVVNATLRWEYRPGWVLFLVYARNQTAPPSFEADPQRHSLAPSGLDAGPTIDSVLLKWSFLLRT
jgi:hypothetical protein